MLILLSKISKFLSKVVVLLFVFLFEYALGLPFLSFFVFVLFLDTFRRFRYRLLFTVLLSLFFGSVYKMEIYFAYLSMLMPLMVYSYLHVLNMGKYKFLSKKFYQVCIASMPGLLLVLVINHYQGVFYYLVQLFLSLLILAILVKINKTSKSELF